MKKSTSNLAAMPSSDNRPGDGKTTNRDIAVAQYMERTRNQFVDSLRLDVRKVVAAHGGVMAGAVRKK